MSSVDSETLIDFPWFGFIVKCLEVGEVLQLRAVSKRARVACSSHELSTWRQKVVLPALMKKYGPPPNQPKDFWMTAPIATDTHLQWLFAGNPGVEAVDFRDAPHIGDETLMTIGSSCHSLRKFRMRRGQDALRLNFDVPLEGLTTIGVEALLHGCPLLEELCLDWCQHVSGDAACKAIQQSPPLCRNLRRLHLSGVSTSDEAVEVLSSCTNLEYLHLGDTTAADLTPLAACTRIRELHVCRGSYIIPEGVVAACRGFGESIRILCCAGCMQINKDAALDVLKLCSKIEIWNCVRGTAVQYECGRSGIFEAMDYHENEVCLDDPEICRGDARWP